MSSAVGTQVGDQQAPPGSRIPSRFLGGGGADARVGLYAYAPIVLAALGLIAWGVSVGHLHPYTAGAYGLVTHLPPAWWMGLILVTAAVVLALVPSSPRTPVVIGTIVAFAVVLHGTLPAAESTPRFEAAYTIAGFSDFIARHGHTLPRIDARMSWFGMLSGGAMASRAMQVSTMWFLRWAPLVFELAYLFPVKALANMSLRSSRARYAALPIFLAGNWIDQDYFSPQAVALLLYLVVVVVAVRTLGGQGLQPRPVRWLVSSRAFQVSREYALRLLYLPLDATPADTKAEPSTARTRAALAFLLLVLVAVIVISHELTPVALCIVLFMLFLAGRTRMRTLWLFCAFCVFAWLSWAAEPFWSGHLSKIFGGVGNVTSTFTSSVSGRSVAHSRGRSVVEASRLLAAGLTWLVAGAGTWMMWRRHKTQWTLLVLAVAPVAVGGAVSYGGEVALRILLFSLAPLAVLAAGLIDGPFLGLKAVLAFAAAGLALVVLFPIARYGNESFEAIAPGDIQATNWIYAHVPVGSTILVFARDEPLLYSHVGDYKTRELGLTVLASVPVIEGALPHRSAYIFMTRTQEEEGQVYSGLPKGWQSSFEQKLSEMPFVHEVMRTSTATVYYVSPRVRPKHHKSTTPTPRPKPHGHPPTHKKAPPRNLHKKSTTPSTTKAPVTHARRRTAPKPPHHTKPTSPTRTSGGSSSSSSSTTSSTTTSTSSTTTTSTTTTTSVPGGTPTP